MQAAPVATTPEVSQPTADVGQPAQLEGGMLEGQAPLEQTPAAPPQEEFFLKAETGTVYKTPEAAAAGIAEKDRYIQQLQELLSQRSQPQAPQVQADPQAAASAAIASLQAEWEQELRSDPKFQGASPEAIAEQAYLNAKSEYRVQQRMAQQYQQQAQQASWQQFIQSNPDLQTPLAKELHDNALANGWKYPNPQAHLDAVHAEMYRRGIPRSQANGVTGAMQNVQQQRQIFGNPVGGSQAPAAEVLSPHVQQALAEAQRRGASAEDLQRVKDIAMNTNFNKFQTGGHRV